MTNNLTTQIEGDFIAMLDEWFSLPQSWDNELDAQIAKWYSNPPKVLPKRPYFSPSSLGSCPRELYIKAKYGNKAKDNFRDKPWRGRQRKLGTLGGDLIQRELLAIEKDYERMTGNKPRFKFERNTDGTPMFEDFAKTNKLVEQDGERFYLYGAPDGIMEYITDDGEKVRVGLEIKSKQTTPARTSLYSMTQPDDSHVKQIVAYAEMFECDYYMILYINYAKKGWDMTDEEYEKTPDIRAFCFEIKEEDKRAVFAKAVEVTRAVREDNPPKLSLEDWKFNNFKVACAESLTDEEFDEIKALVRRVLKSGASSKKKQSYYDAFEFIKDVREGEAKD